MHASRQMPRSEEGSSKISNAKVEAKQMAFGVVMGQKRAMGVVRANGNAEVREGTTGRVVAMLPKVWAVAGAETTKGRVGLQSGETQTPKTQAAKMPKTEVAFYRKYTEALLRRYMQMRMEAGRVPSMMGRSVLGGKASSYRIHGFDDAVIFRLDVERCLRKLEPEQREVIRRVTLQEYTQGEAAALLGICLRTCVQRYSQAIDRLTEILLECRLLEPFKSLSSTPKRAR